MCGLPKPKDKYRNIRRVDQTTGPKRDAQKKRALCGHTQGGPAGPFSTATLLQPNTHKFKAQLASQETIPRNSTGTVDSPVIGRQRPLSVSSTTIHMIMGKNCTYELEHKETIKLNIYTLEDEDPSSIYAW